MDYFRRFFGSFKDLFLQETPEEQQFINNSQGRKRSAPNFEPELTDDEGEFPMSAHLPRKRMRSSTNNDGTTLSTVSQIFPSKLRSLNNNINNIDRNLVIENLSQVTNNRNSLNQSTPKQSSCFPTFFRNKQKHSSNLNSINKKPLKAKKSEPTLLDRVRRTKFLAPWRHDLLVTKHDVIRLTEKEEYQALLEHMTNGDNRTLNIKSSPFINRGMKEFGSNSTILSRPSSSSSSSSKHLTFSKVPYSSLLEGQINNWENSIPNSVFVRTSAPAHSTPISTSSTSSGSSHLPKLYSPQQQASSYFPSPRLASESTKVAETIDLTQENNGRSSSSIISSRSTDDDIVPLDESPPSRVRSPVTTCTPSSNRIFRPDQLPQRIKDILNNSLGPKQQPEVIEIKDDESDISTSANVSPREWKSNNISAVGEDIQIFSESLLSKRSPTNSLDIEHSNYPCTSEKWLRERRTSFAESQKEKKKLIKEQEAKLKILRDESTLSKDLDLERVRRSLTLTHIIELEPPKEEKPEITDHMYQLINRARNSYNQKQVLRTTPNNIEIIVADIKSLGPQQWLNDNVINSYLDMIALRSREDKKLPSVYVFTTFFYPKYIKEGYSTILKRWTRKVDIFSYDLLIYPIHLGVHWCLAVVDMRVKTIKYYDSMGGKNYRCVKALLDYLSQERRERKKDELNKDEWITEIVEDIPQQQNGSDCGMFACKFAEYLSRDAKLTFQQEDMNYYRERMIYEILEQKLLHP